MPLFSFTDIDTLWNSSNETRLAMFIASAVILFYACDIICRKIVVPAVNKVTSRTKSRWDDILFNKDVLTNISRLIPPIVLMLILPYLFEKSHGIFFWTDKIINIYIVATATRLSFAIFNSLYDIYNQDKRAKNRTLKGVFEMFKIISLCIGAIIIIFLYVSLLARGSTIARLCSNEYAKIAVGGLSVLITGQAFMHMFVNVDIGPMTGQTLPLISHGSFAFLVFCIAFGVILSISRMARKRIQEEEEAAIPIYDNNADDIQVSMDILEHIDSDL